MMSDRLGMVRRPGPYDLGQETWPLRLGSGDLAPTTWVRRPGPYNWVRRPGPYNWVRRPGPYDLGQETWPLQLGAEI
jgi:hypothetical protein